MLKSLCFLSAFLLTACSIQPAHQYDAVEYDYVIKTVVATGRAVHLCDERDSSEKFIVRIQEINDNTMHLAEYEKYVLYNKDTLPAVTNLRDLVLSFTKNKNYSKQYCLHKISEIQSASRVLAMSLGKNSGFNVCDSDVSTRYMVYRASYMQGLITRYEFNDLVHDLTHLSKIDQSGCSMEEKAEFEKAINIISNVAAVVGAL